MSETKEADGKWLIALCKFSKDRFLNVGPLHPENDQLIDISGEKMRLVKDEPAYSEPHDCVVVRRDLIHPEAINPRKTPRFKLYEQWAKEDGVDLMRDNKVIKKEGNVYRVYITSMAPKYLMTEFRVKKGATVQVIHTNIDNVEDLSHGFCMSLHDVCMGVNPQETNSVTFKASDTPGVYWYYCPWFCHALHLEMRGRMIVEPDQCRSTAPALARPEQAPEEGMTHPSRRALVALLMASVRCCSARTRGPRRGTRSSSTARGSTARACCPGPRASRGRRRRRPTRSATTRRARSSVGSSCPRTSSTSRPTPASRW